jgi:hypothetical protein
MNCAERTTTYLFATLVVAGILACGFGGRGGGGEQPPPPTPSAPSTASPVPPSPAQLMPTEAFPAGDVIAANMQRYSQQFAQGMVPATALFRGTLAKGATQDFQAILTAGKCYTIIGVGGPTVTDLDLKLFDQNQVQIKQDVATDNFPVLGLSSDRICPQDNGNYRVQVEMYDGSGEFGVQVFATP